MGDTLFPRFYVKPLVLALAAGFAMTPTLAAPSLAVGGAVSCRALGAPKHMVPPPQLSGEAATDGEGVTRITAEDMQGQSQTRVRAKGAVVVERDAQALNADWVDYDQNSHTVQAGDHFTLADGVSRVQGEKLTYNLQQRTGAAQNVRFEAENNGRRLQGAGDKVEMVGKRYRLTQTRFNTCDPNDESWYIEAASIDADYDKNIGVARNAKVVLGKVPILYTPWIDFPLNGQRKSGLLAPTLKVGSDGIELSTPYYLNLAPNYDATLRPQFIARRGLQLGGEFRYLQPKYGGKVSGDWLPDDRASRHNHRYRFDWTHHHRFSASLTGGVDFHQVSDDDYYRDLMGSALNSNTHLNRQLWLSHQAALGGGQWQNYFTVQKYQTLASASGYRNRPYAVLPQLGSSWLRHFNNTFSAHVMGQATRFDHDVKQAGSRFVLYPSVTAHFHNSWGFVRPKVGVHATHYRLDAFNGQPRRSANRVLPIVSVHSGMTLERPLSLKGQSLVQTLEPRLYYAYIPKRDQSHLPNFDTSENSFTYEQLFRENLFSGQDRINAAHFLTAALQTRLYDGKTGAERFNAGVGQRFYFNKDDVLLDGSVQQNVRDRSDILAFAYGRLSDSVHAETQWHYNQSLKRTEKFNIGMRYNPAPGKTVAMRYRYGRFEELYDNHYGRSKQVDVAVQWPVRQNYYLVGRYNYDLTHSRTLQQLVGVEYRSPCRCWSASLVGQRYVNGLGSSKNAVYFQLQLRDLTSVGNNPFEQLRTAIPGYSSIYEVKKP